MLPIYLAALNLVSQVAGRAQARLSRDDRGATAVEYGLMVALIAGAIALIVWQLGDNLAGLFGDTSDCIAAPGDGAC